MLCKLNGMEAITMNTFEIEQDRSDEIVAAASPRLSPQYVPPTLEKMQQLAEVTGQPAITGVVT
jgi:hypothetical protein